MEPDIVLTLWDALYAFLGLVGGVFAEKYASKKRRKR